MSYSRLIKLTHQQESLIPGFRQKWLKSTIQPIDKLVAKETLKKLYNYYNLPEPKIIFVSSPVIAISLVEEYLSDLLKENEFGSFSIFYNYFKIVNKFFNNLNYIDIALNNYLIDNICDYISNQLELVYTNVPMVWCNAYTYTPAQFGGYAALYEFYKTLEVFDETVPELDLLLHLCQYFGLIYECSKINVIIVCDRPNKILRDAESRIHAEGEPAIVFGDGDWAHYVYFHHGMMLPDKYGMIHPQQWQSHWILEEKNAKLRQILIETIGSDRLEKELPTIELDSDQEYKLFKIDNYEHQQPIHLLKMPCSKTQRTKTFLVPPDMSLVKDAREWINFKI